MSIYTRSVVVAHPEHPLVGPRFVSIHILVELSLQINENPIAPLFEQE
jgi:hypothetical protein